MRTMRRASNARRVAASLSWPRMVKASITCAPIRNVGFRAEPGSWYTIEAWRALNCRSSRSAILVTSAPPTRIRPPVITPLAGR